MSIDSEHSQIITKPWFDHKVDLILQFLFLQESTVQKQQYHQQVQHYLHELDLAASYFLFDLIQERLPHRAKVLFAGENYQGKKETIREVMDHLMKAA